MNKFNIFKTSLLLIAIIGFTFSVTFLQAQHLFSVNYNDLSKENVIYLNAQVANSEVSTLSLTKNNSNKDVYSVVLSSVQNTKIIILNEETGAHVTITPAEESLLTEFQLASFFIEELKQAVLGDVNRYLVMEVDLNFLVKNVAAVSAAKRDVFIPQYLYGKKGNVKEAFPKDRQIVNIFKEKPRYIFDHTEDTEFLQYIAQLEKTMSYYVYMYKLPDGGLWIYDEHFNHDNDKSGTRTGEHLEFILSGNLDATQETATLFALNLWSEVLSSSVPVDISVMSINLGNPQVIGQSYRQPNYWNPETETWYCSALGNHMAGYNVVPNQRDIRLEMNSQFNFYYQITGNPGYSQTDWITTMLHEACHGLGFYTLCGSDGSYSYTTSSGSGASTSFPGAFDRQLFQGLTGPALTSLTQTERAALVKSGPNVSSWSPSYGDGDLYAGAPESHLLAANGGVRVRMFTPSSWQGGSSVSHWSSNVSFPTFMRYYLSGKLHSIGTRKIGIMLDMGWTQPMIDPDASWVTFHANGGEGNMSKQQFLPEQTQELRINDFSRTGYTFENWNTEPDGEGDTFTANQSITISNDMDLYVQWQANTYTLTFNPNGGTVSPTSKEVTFGEPVGELPIPIRAGHAFQEWRIGATPVREETIWNHTQAMTVTARWITLSISDTQHTVSLQIIPNPASHTIELRITGYELRIDKIEFYNIFGQIVKSVPFAGQTIKDEVSQKIDISDLNAGIYMVKIGDQTVKLVVN